MASSELKEATAIAEGKKKGSDAKTRGLLGDALGQVERLGGRLTAMRERTGEATESLLYTGETVGVNFVASFAEGYWGEDKMDVGSVDGRTLAGVGLGAWGMYDLLRGKGGGHKLALGTGLRRGELARLTWRDLDLVNGATYYYRIAALDAAIKR